MTSSNTVQTETFKHARPLDVHTWSEYPEVNTFVNQLFDLISSFEGNKKYWQEIGQSNLVGPLRSLVSRPQSQGHVQP